MVKLYERCLVPAETSFFLFGMRGTGKTTWARQHFGDARWIDLLREDVYQSYLAEAGLFRRELAGCAPASWVVIDEIQRLPSLLNEVHGLIEERGLRA